MAAVIAFSSGAMRAQDTNELLKRMQAMEERIRALEAEVQTLRTQQAAIPNAAAPAARAASPAGAQIAQGGPPPSPTPMEPPPEPVSLGGAGAAAAKALNPDISVIGDFVGAAGNHGGRATPSLAMHESEIGLQEVIDPYARADFFLSFGEQGVDLEEGYLTFTSLPAGLQLKVGKMRAAFGKVNTTHNHALPWIDRPLVTQNLVAGEEGINDAGLSLSRILPSPKGLFLEGTAQVFRGDSENVFSAARRSDVAAVGHLRAYSDLSESTNVDFGASYARGHSPYADGHNELFGADATLRWKPLRRSIYHSFVGRSELVWTRTSAPLPYVIGTTATSLVEQTQAKPFGFYVSGDYQLNRRWYVGARFDRSGRGQCLQTSPASDLSCSEGVSLASASQRGFPLLTDTGGSFLFTYVPSEFSLIRTQFRRSSYGDGRTANEVLLQFQFSMGAHGAHPF